MRVTTKTLQLLPLLALVIAGCEEASGPTAGPRLDASVLMSQELRQEDRFGLPAIATVFIPTNLKDAYNEAPPAQDRANFKSLIVQKLIAFGQTPAAADGLADALTPDIQPIDLSQPSGFLNGRKLDAHLEDVKRAEVVARSVMPLVSDTAGAYARLGVIYLTQHEFREAYDAARRAVAWNSNNQEALGLLFDAAMATGRYAVAESTLNRLTPGRLPYQLRLAHFLAAQGRTDGAYYALERACRQLERAQIRPQAVAWCVTELAKVQHAREGEAPASALFRRALAIQPGYRAALEGLADLAYARRDWREAGPLYARIAADAHPDLYLRLAEVYRALGEPAAAEGWEREFLRVARAPGAEALYAHPLALYYAARPMTLDTALAIARRDVAPRPAVESWDVLLWILLRPGDVAP